MGNIISVSLILILFGVFCVLLIPLFQRISIKIRGEKFNFFIGRKHLRSKRDWWDFLVSVLVGTLSFFIAGLIVIYLNEIKLLTK
ncbi:MAG: hypothetical protein ABIA97_04145 [Candidatus Omnitrophota bacterium]